MASTLENHLLTKLHSANFLSMRPRQADPIGHGWGDPSGRAFGPACPGPILLPLPPQKGSRASICTSVVSTLESLWEYSMSLPLENSNLSPPIPQSGPAT